MSRQQRNFKQRRQRGVALLMVLSALTVLAVMLTEFQQETSAELGSVMAERDAVQAEYAAKSAIALSRLLLAAEPTIRKPLSFLLQNAQIPIWQHASLVMSAFNDPKSVKDFGALIGGSMEKTKALGIPGASFEVVIVDEDSKINLNAASRGAGYKAQVAQQILGLIGPPQYDRLFEGRDAEGNFNERPTVCSAIIDWTDTDMTTDSCLSTSQAQGTEGGAEDSFYQMLKRPYERKNAAFDSLEELHRVRGVSDDFWATFVDPDPDDPKSRIVTVWGSDKLNVNTSNAVATLAAVCAAVPVGLTTPVCNDMAVRAKAVTVMEMFRQLSAGIPVFHSVNQFISILKPSASANPMGSANPAASAMGMGGLSSMMMGPPSLEMMGIPPIPALVDALLQKTLGVQSQVFSIYATGIVKSGRRETRTRIQMVVDLRGAPPPGKLPQNIIDQLLGTSPSATAAAPTASASASTMASALPTGPQPDGNVLYYRFN
jgi:general secretion pathway protein K